MSREQVYRGVVEYIHTNTVDTPDGPQQQQVLTQHRSKAYDKPGPAKAWVTSRKKSPYYDGTITDTYIEVSTAWERA